MISLSFLSSSSSSLYSLTFCASPPTSHFIAPFHDSSSFPSASSLVHSTVESLLTLSSQHNVESLNSRGGIQVSFHKRDEYPAPVFVADGSQGWDLMNLSSSSDYFLIKGVSDGGNE